MAAKMVSAAVIGVGNMGRHHARVYSELEGVRLAAVSDLNEKAGEEVSKKLGCRYYKDFEEMLLKEKPEIVSIAVPTKLHKAVAVKAMNAGANVLVEKPIADSVKDAEEMISCARKNKVKLSCGHIERFNPAVTKLKEIITEGRLGEITSIMVRRVGLFPPQIQDANVITDLAIHDIDVLNHLFGKTPISVCANGGKALTSKREDYAEILLTYAGGASGVIQVNWITPVKIRKLSVTGTRGYAELDYITQDIVLYESNYKRDFADFGDFVVKFGAPNEVKISVDKAEPLKLELKDFSDAVREGREPHVKAEEALSALRVAVEINEKLSKSKK